MFLDQTTVRHALTGVYDRLEGEVAALYVEGEIINVHPAGADQHVVILDFHVTSIVDREIRTRRSSVLFCPARKKHLKCVNLMAWK